MDINTILEKRPGSTQNPLLSTREFFKHCKRRFRWVNRENAFIEWLESNVKEGTLRASFSHQGTSYFSTYQVWQINKLNSEDFIARRASKEDAFESVVRLLTRIQDFYLPEVRSDQRVGQHDDYGAVGIDGTYFYSKTQYLLSDIRAQRRFNIEHGRFDPAEVASSVGLHTKELSRWFDTFMFYAKRLDPLSDWHLLVKYLPYEKRQKLKFEALLAQDLYEMAELLKHFITDIDIDPSISDPVDWGDSSSRERPSAPPQWKVRRYGDSLTRPYEMLEFLTNEYNLNSKPRAIVFTEGEEWKAVEKLYSYYGYSPELLGIECRSISGEGNFSLANWQCFIEYMHEKQILVYFLLDNEGRTVKEAKRLLNKKRTFSFPGLERVIPSRDRIRVWPQSFEESNFTDAQIKRALARQEIRMSSQEVSAVRAESRTKGLINALSYKLGTPVNKPRLDIDLADDLILRRRKRPDVKSLRPIERFVKQSAHSILLNHQPTGQEHRRLNIETGFLG